MESEKTYSEPADSKSRVRSYLQLHDVSLVFSSGGSHIEASSSPTSINHLQETGTYQICGIRTEKVLPRCDS